MSLLGEAMKDLFAKKTPAQKEMSDEKKVLLKQFQELEKREKESEKKPEIRSIKVAEQQPIVEKQPELQIEDIIVAIYNKEMEIDATLKEMQEALILLLKK